MRKRTRSAPYFPAYITMTMLQRLDIIKCINTHFQLSLMPYLDFDCYVYEMEKATDDICGISTSLKLGTWGRAGMMHLKGI
jgi:hypothetical protein